MKVLYDYNTYPAFMIREMLKVSWGKFSPHIANLITKNYIISKEEFYQGSPTRMLHISTLGVHEFSNLKKVMQNLLEY